MVTWGVTDAGVSRIGCDLGIEIAAGDWMENASTVRPALVDDCGEQSSIGSHANAPITGPTARLTIPTTTARLKEAAVTIYRSTARRRAIDTEQTYTSLFHGEETTRLADHSFPLSEGSSRLSCTLSSVSAVGARGADAGSATVVAQFQGPATLDRKERVVHLPFDRPRSV
jgi:hypothetical protein